MRQKNCWTEQENEFLKRNYISMSWTQLQYNLENRTQQSIRVQANKLGFKKQPGSLDYTVNENFFDTWNAEVAYVLGYIVADGCLAVRPAQCSHTLKFCSKDWRLLIKIRKALSSDHLLSFKKVNNKTYYLLSIGSKKIIKKLLSLGILPCTNSAKTKYQKFPQIPQPYISHFIRGNFDGDGCIYLTKTGKKRNNIVLHLNFKGTISFLNKLSQIVNSQLNVTLKVPYTYRGNHELCYHNNEAIRILDWLYKNADIYLERKFKKYKENRHKGIKRKLARNKYIPLEEVLSGVN